MAPCQPFGPDAEILNLGVILDHFIVRKREAWTLVGADYEDDDPEYLRTWAASNDTFVVIKQITGLQARTLEGLLVKARAVQMCHGDIGALEVDDLIFSIHPSDMETTIASIIRDLVAISLPQGN